MLTSTALNLAVAAVGSAANSLRLHSGAPGATGNSNLIANTTTTVAYAAGTVGVRDLATTYSIPIPPSTTVSHYTVWQGSTLLVVDNFANSETYNAAGTANVSSARITIQNIV